LRTPHTLFLAAALILAALAAIFLIFGQESASKPQVYYEIDSERADLIRPARNIELFKSENSPKKPKKQDKTALNPPKSAQIVLVMDDLGMNSRYTQAVSQLPGPISMAFLPYAPNVAKQAHEARRRGHEIMLHMPMEPLNPYLDLGPSPLRVGYSPLKIKQILKESVAKIGGVVAVNNHMGSRLTASPAEMAAVMDFMKENHLMYLDSMTTAASVALKTARQHRVSHARRDIFIDHENTPEFIEAQLEKTINHAKSEGYAIVIAHPRPETMRQLGPWLDSLKRHNIQLTSLSALILQYPELALDHQDAIKVAQNQ